MEEKKTQKERIQWHPGFFAGIQIELEEDAENLMFENEHQLGTKPMEIDVLVIKKNSDIPVHKNIGRIFRKYNIIEYKSPDDYLSIDDYYKVYGYSCFYKADTEQVNFIKIEELTITFVCSKYPSKLIRHLKEHRNYEVIKVEKGIYQIIGDVLPIQIIITNRLTHKENIWLKSLAGEIKETAIVEKILQLYEDNKKNPLYDSVMNLIVRTNQDKFEEVRDMCEALEELMKDKIEEKVKLAAKAAYEQAEKECMERGEKIGMERGEEIGKEIGKEIGENRVNNLIVLLSKSGRMDDIVKAAQDKAYQNKLFKEFDL